VNNYLTESKSYLAAVLLCLLVLTCTMRLWRADFHVPFNYGLDALFYETIVKGTIENGWYLTNNSVGAPTGLRMHDFPIPDAFNFLLIKGLALIHADYAWVINVFFLLTFPLTTLSSMFAFRQFQLSPASSIGWSLLYTFAPFHFFPGIQHLFAATYYVVPLIAVVTLWVMSGELFGDSGERERPRLNLRSRKFMISVVACALASSVGFGYYAFLSAFFILVAGVGAVISYRSLRMLAPAAILTTVICVGLMANLAPNFVYLHQHGNPHIVQRNPVEAEVFGLKLAPMLLPIRNHRITALAQLTDSYSRNTVGSKASEMAALGLVATSGFLFLTIWILFVAPARRFDGDGTVAIFNRLGTLTTAAVLLGTVGGFSSLFALLVFPQIRSYHRISLYIAFFSLLAIGILIEEFFKRRRYFVPRPVRYVALAIIVIVGILDQTSDSFVPAYSRTKADFTNDEAFVSAINERLPSQAMIFQLPYTSFPEGAASNLMTDYELFRGYLHSHNLRWSYGAMKGRDGDTWLQQTSARPIPEMLDTLAYAGFSGIYIDRLGYRDEGSALEGELKGLIHQEPLVSNDKRLAFFDLTDFKQQLSQHHSPSEFSQRQRLALSPLLLSLGGCSGLEGSSLESWRWCSAVSDLTVKNASDENRMIQVEMRFASGYPEAANLELNGPTFSEQLQINSDGVSYSKRIEIPPGTWTIMLFCDGKRVHAPSDERDLVFRIINLRWKELDRSLLK